MAEEYGKKVRKHQVERMPAHFATGKFPEWDGTSDFQSKAAYASGFDAGVYAATELLRAVLDDLKNVNV